MLHQVLEIDVRRTPRNHYRVQQLCAKLALVDLAGSERAAGIAIWSVCWGSHHSHTYAFRTKASLYFEVPKILHQRSKLASTNMCMGLHIFWVNLCLYPPSHWMPMNPGTGTDALAFLPPFPFTFLSHRYEQRRPEATRRRQHQPIAAGARQLHQCTGETQRQQGGVLCALPEQQADQVGDVPRVLEESVLSGSCLHG